MRLMHLIDTGSKAPCGALLTDGGTHERPRNWSISSQFANGDPPPGFVWCPGCQAIARHQARTKPAPSPMPWALLLALALLVGCVAPLAAPVVGDGPGCGTHCGCPAAADHCGMPCTGCCDPMPCKPAPPPPTGSR